MLTGQCLKDFEKWYKDYSRKHQNTILTSGMYDTDHFIISDIDFDELPNSMQYGVYVDFFDSVGIVIGLNSTIRLDKNQIFRVYVNKVKIDPHPKTRPEARTEAIEKANEIYNQRFQNDKFSCT